MDRAMTLKLLALAVLLPASLFFSGEAYADDCSGCHRNPRYKKEDAQKLKQCLACHGMAGHPYKADTGTGGGGGVTAVAEAAERAVAAGPDPDTGDMVFIPAGEFLMGSDDRLRDEKPAHVVYVNEFYIDRLELTNKEYKSFVDAGHPPPSNWEENREGKSYPPEKADHPVIFVSWNDADAYCRWRGKRLPREREWEKAARGTDGRIYPWGNEWDLDKSNNPLRGHEGTMPAGSIEEGKNQFGLYEMSGNVWEWVDDHYFPHPGSDYVSPEFGRKYRLLKGGSWWDCMFYGCGISAPAYNRAFFDATTKNDSFGFRCAADAK
ncbi:MAG: SUMF1/EgtB/PvdO family nonheme iron enzyme [Thermodesulfobacteriota bacterium]